MKKIFLLGLTCLGLSAASIASANTVVIGGGCCGPRMVMASCGSCCARPTCYRSCYRPCRPRCCAPRCCAPRCCPTRCCGGMW